MKLNLLQHLQDSYGHIRSSRVVYALRKQYYKLTRRIAHLPIARLPRRAKVTGMLLIGLVVFGGITAHYFFGSVRAQTSTISPNDIVDGVIPNDDLAIVNSNMALQLAKGNQGTWEYDDGSRLFPNNTFNDNAMTLGPNNNMYAINTGNSQCQLFVYDITLKEWTALERPPFGCGGGVQLVYDKVGRFYFIPGNQSDRFAVYDVATDTWKALADAPTQFGNGAAATFATRAGSKYVYAFRGLSSASFWRYDIAADTWSNVAAFPANSDVNYGLSATWDGNDTIYARSNLRREFKKYSITTNSWSPISDESDSWIKYDLDLVQGKIVSFGLAWGSGETTYLESYNPDTSAWTSLPRPPIGGHHYDGAVPFDYDGSRYGYTIIGSDIDLSMYRYDFSLNKWDAKSILDQTLDNSAHHMGMIFDGNQTMYFVGGPYWQSADRVYKYDLVTGVTTRIGSQLGVTSGWSGWTGVFYNGAVYFTGNEGQRAFQRYDPILNAWTQLADMPYSGGWGSSIVDGGDGYLYMTFQQTNRLSRYDPSTNTWAALTNMPENTGVGGGMARIGRTLYVQDGANSARFYKYNMDTNVWSTIREFPNGYVDHGGFIVGDGTRYLYSSPGTRTSPQNRSFFRYDTVSDVWEKMMDMPDDVQPGASATYDSVRNKIIVAQGFRHPKIWRYSPSSSTYKTTGDWYSRTIDLKDVASWSSLQYTVTGTGTATPYVRTSPNGRIWSSWSVVNAGNISAPMDRYAQVRMSLSGSGSATPTVSDISFQYSQDTTPPNPPVTFTAMGSDTDSTPLISGQTYEHQHPVFTWGGATDGSGSGVGGYYVYFGTNSAADPAVEGSLQKSTKYVVTTSMTAGEIYYVRIKTVDNMGNVGAAATYFSYRYWYISPPGSQVVTSQADFQGGVNTSLNVTAGGSLQLPQQSNGVWANGPTESLPTNFRGGTLEMANGYLYMLRGHGTTEFYRFNVVNRIWETLAPIPLGVYDGSSMAWDGGSYMYAMRGNNRSDSLFRYNINDNIWQTIGSLPTNVQQGSDLVYIGNGKLAFFFTGVKEFYIYDIATNLYEIKMSYPDSINSGGSGIWYDGGDYIYAYGGSYPWNNNRKAMIRYSIANDSWVQLAQPPYIVSYMQNNLVSDSAGHLYIFGNSYLDNTEPQMRGMRYTIATDTWDSIPNNPAQSAFGSVASDGDRYIYLIPTNWASNDRHIFRYDTLNQIFTPSLRTPDGWRRLTWDIPTNTWGWQQGNATTATYDGSKYTYVIGADEGYGGRLLRYDPRTGSSKYLAPPPSHGVGQSMAYLNGSLYLQEGWSSRRFHKYVIAEDRWYRVADLTNNSYRPGPSTLIALNDGRIFSANGNNKQFYIYTPDSGQGSWVRVADLPGAATNVQNGSSVYDATNGYVYMLLGNNSNHFYRYNVAANTWVQMASLPAGTWGGASMALHNGKIYAALGNSTRTTYVYTIASNSWVGGPIAPEDFKYGSQYVQVDQDYFIALTGDDSGAFWRFNYDGASVAYSPEGVHTSQPMLMSGIYDYAGIKAEVDTPAGTQVEFFTRTSDNGVAWNNWVRTDESKNFGGQISTIIRSPAKKYIQVKIVLDSFDNLHTPTVGSYAVDYYFDIDPPNNPTALTVYQDSTKTNELTSNTWYNFPRAMLDWPEPGEGGGATDGPLGSHIKGYYVYVGTDPTAQPVTAGQYVSTSELELNLGYSATYYVRIQAVDVTGNVATDVYAPFIYKLDIDPPTTPSLITVTPAGFTSIDNYVFEWPNGYDTHSGVKSYCYHTGATSGPLAAETCQTGRELRDIQAQYRQGTNIFYVRTLDNAGNFSSSYITTSYYYSVDPPSAVTNLRAVPPVSAQNLFAFTWDLPVYYAGDPEQLVYCYSVNILPSPENTTCSAGKFIPPFKAATQQGTNILYVVAKDEADNVNWANYASAVYIANTVSPGIPLNLSVADTSDRSRNRWSLTSSWDIPVFEGNGIATYIVERSEDTHTFKVIGKTSSRAYVDMDIEQGVPYTYRVRAADNVDNQGGPSGTVTLVAKGSYATPPNTVVAPTIKAGFDQALVSWVTDRPSTTFVYYGTSPTSLTQSKGVLDPVSQHSINLTGLLPTTTYYYKVQSFDADRTYNTSDADSQLYTFRTTETARIYGVTSSDKTLNTSVIGWKTTVPVVAFVEYGETIDYGLTSTEGGDTLASSGLTKLSGLASGKTYHYRIVGTTDSGSKLRSDDYTFQTLPRPAISNVRLQPITDAVTISVQVSWDTNVPTSSTLRYDVFGDRKEVTTSELTTHHEVTLADLAGATDYVLNVEGRDAYGNLALSDRQTWRSTVDTRPPKIDKVSISTVTTDSLKGSRAQMIVTWHTDEPATTQLRYGLRSGELGQLTPLDADPTTEHTVIVSDLNVSDIYRVQPMSRDISGNTVNGNVSSVVTPDKDVNVLDRLLNALQKVFRF